MNLTLEQYEALLALAKLSTVNPDGTIDQTKAIELDRYLRQIEQDNSITRSSLWIRWQDPNAPLPPGTNFPTVWPPQLQYFLQLLTRPIAEADVLQVVQQRTPAAQLIMVTKDPAGLVGWTKLADYFQRP